MKKKQSEGRSFISVLDSFILLHRSLIYASALPVLFKFEIPTRHREIDVCSAEFTVAELVWCTEPTQNCQGQQTARLRSDASRAITTCVTANGPHPQCVCVIRPLTSTWPDLSSPGFLRLFQLVLHPHFCHFKGDLQWKQCFYLGFVK